MNDLIAAFGLVLVIEGALYTLAPETMKRLMAACQALPPTTLRTGGLIAAVLGIAIVWLARQKGVGPE